MGMEEIWVVGDEGGGGWSLSTLAMRGGKKGTWEATPGKLKDRGLGFVNGGMGRRINGGEG